MTLTFLIVMGVCGCGKTTLGQATAAALGWDFYDADDFHPATNIAKMRSGLALTDEDRAPWLAALHTLIATQCAAGHPGVLACSALKARYRAVLLAGQVPAGVVYLKGSQALIAARLAQRTGHFMSPALLESQFAALEEPQDALVVDIAWPPAKAVAAIIDWVSQKRS